MKIEIDTVKGFQDFLPPTSLKRREIREIIEKNYRLFGFLPVETPIIEFDELMKSDALGGEDQAISDRFRLKDRAGRNIGLRYEFTFQLSRLFKQNPNIKLPFRRYQIGPVFRDEPVSKGRFRQFTQCDADIIGDPEVTAEFECLSLINSILKKLNIPTTIQVNNRELLNSIIASVQIKETKNVMRELDKIDKIGEDSVKANLRKFADANQILTLFRLLDKDINFFKENAFDGIDELMELMELCKKAKISATFNPYMIRGLEYYTGNIFEVKERGKESIAGGGRYDKVVGKFLEREIPAVGVSFGLERVTEITQLIPEPAVKTIIISLYKDDLAREIEFKLRKLNISCITFRGKPGKALEFADYYKVPYVIFIGEEESDKNKFKLKDMETGVEKLLTEKQLINKLS